MPTKKYLLLEIQRWQVFVAVKLVEVGAEKVVLDDAVFFKLSLGIFLCLLCRHLPSVFQNGISTSFQNDIYTFRPILHCHGNVTVCHALGKIQNGVD